MNITEIKTTIMQDAGNFSKWDIAYILKLSSEELRELIRQVQKKIVQSKVSIAFIVILSLLKIINIQTSFLHPYITSKGSDMLFFIALLGVNIYWTINLKRKEYVYQLVLQAEKLRYA